VSAGKALGALPMLATAQGQASVMRPPAHPAAKESPQEPNQLLHIPKAQTGKAVAPVMSGGGCESVTWTLMVNCRFP